ALFVRAPDLETRRAGHAVTQRAHFAARDIDRVHVEELDLGYRTAVQLLDYVLRVRSLNLIAIVPPRHRTAAGDRRRAFVARRLDVESAGFRVELNPVRGRRPAHIEQLVLFEMKEDAVADDVAVGRAGSVLLRAIDGERREAVGRRVREELQRVRSFDEHLGHVVGLVEQYAAVTPRTLLFAPVGVLRGDDRIDIRADLRVAEHRDGVARRAQRIFQALLAHDSR